jgi:hypothetical protein
MSGATSGTAFSFPQRFSRFPLSRSASTSSTCDGRHALARRAAGRYNPDMRRPTRISLVVAVLLIAIFGAYSAFWFVVAGRIEDGVAQWAGSLREQNLDLSWRTIGFGGFPLAFRVELSDARLRGRTVASTGEVHLPLLSGSARPWNLRLWQLTASEGLSAEANLAAGAVATLTARKASGSVSVADEGGGTMWLSLGEPSADAGGHIAAGDADLWLILPPHMPQTHDERAVGIALDLRALTLPAVPVPFRNPVDEIALGVTVMGAIPAAPPRRAAASWRDSGGTLELDHFALRWGTLSVTGSGTVALDPDLQPIGSFSGTVAGYDELMKALVAAGRLRPGEARLAGIALAMLAKPGPDGHPEIATSFTIQNGEMYLGPVKLGKAPRIDWE